MKNSGQIILLVSSIVVIGTLGYLLMKESKLEKVKPPQPEKKRTIEEMREDFYKYGF